MTQKKHLALKSAHLQASEENFWKCVFSIEWNKSSLPLTKQNEKKSRFKRQWMGKTRHGGIIKSTFESIFEFSRKRNLQRSETRKKEDYHKVRRTEEEKPLWLCN